MSIARVPGTTRSVRLEPRIAVKLRDTLLAPVSERRRVRRALGQQQPPALRYVYVQMATAPGVPLILLKNPKAGCTSLAQILHYLSCGRFHDGDIHREHEVLNQGQYAWQTNAAQIGQPGRMLFTFVRHPEARAYSAFRNFFVDRKNSWAGAHIPSLESFGYSADRDESYNFNAFLDYVEASLKLDPLLTDRHWRTQLRNTGADLLDYALIGKVEEFQADLARLLDRLGLDAGRRSAVLESRFNRSSASRAQVDPGQRRRIEALYAEDYEAFGY